MQDVRLAQAADGDWGTLAKTCADQLVSDGQVAGNGADAGLGILYASDLLADDLASLLTFLSARTGIADWVGTVGLGVCATGVAYFDRPALVAMTARFPENSLYLGAATVDDDGVARIDAGVVGFGPGLGLVHGDPTSPHIAGLVATLAAESDCFLVGGLTASRGGFGQIAGGVVAGGLSGVLFSERVPVATGLTQGCAPIGPMRTITACDGPVLRALEDGSGQAALEADLGLRVDEDGFVEALADIHAAIAVAGSDTGDYLVRNLTGLDPEHGWLAVGERLEPGQRIMFCRRDAAAAESDLRRMLDGLDRRLESAPRAALYHSCVGRGPNLFDGESRELRIIRDVLGPVPLVGFFGNGEISHDRVYGYTGVLTLFL